jgi:Rrf2 family protein|tara:strand:- start:345 stop:740 length:396 start_codon:yes stop_codon:yes gene_type:complete
MFKFSKTVEYALISLSHINKCDSSLPISVRQISDHYNIPYELLAKILQKLSKSHILVSVKGPKGGYKLKSKYKNLTLIEFIEILEGPFGITGCLADIECEQLSNCNIINPLDKINSKIYRVFNDIKLNQLT